MTTTPSFVQLIMASFGIISVENRIQHLPSARMRSIPKCVLRPFMSHTAVEAARALGGIRRAGLADILGGLVGGVQAVALRCLCSVFYTKIKRGLCIKDMLRFNIYLGRRSREKTGGNESVPLFDRHARDACE